jgi:hypothetical protein
MSAIEIGAHAHVPGVEAFAARQIQRERIQPAQGRELPLEQSLSIPLEGRKTLPKTLRHEKDPSRVLNGVPTIFYSGNQGDTQDGWGQFSYALDPQSGEWVHKGQVTFEGVDGQTKCAMGANYDHDRGIFEGLLQTRVFHPGGQIVAVTSKDGLKFTKDRVVLAADEESGENFYDPEPVRGLGKGGKVIMADGSQKRLFTVTHVDEYRYTEVPWGLKSNAVGGRVDLYELPDEGDAKFVSTLFREETVQGHLPTREGGEWPNEGFSLVQVDGNLFMAAGVLFQPGIEGNTQRAAIFASESVEGPWEPFGIIEPNPNADNPILRQGETGHPSLFVEKDTAGDPNRDRIIINFQTKPLGGVWSLEEGSFSAKAVRDELAARRNSKPLIQ